MAVLIGATAGIAYASELFVGVVEHVTEGVGLSPLFTGVVLLPLPRHDIAASDIRRQLADGVPPAQLAPLVGAAVAGYIDHHQPYPRGTTEGSRG